jgi:subtilisin-like proprotein convertase family protein
LLYCPPVKYLAPLSLVVFVGCAAIDSPSDEQSAALSNGSPQAVGVLRLLNAEQVGFETLDVDVGLDRRAAENLIAHRDGPDGFYHTNDDDFFDTLEEVDSISYVGPSAMAKLVAYAEANSYVPGPDEILGSFEGVLFTVAEAQSALELCNEESEGVLDGEIGLDSRAVDGIFDARPFATMTELAAAYYVGKSALGKLKAYVKAPAPGERADCRHHGDCKSTESCRGIPFDGSSDFGKCAPKGNVAGAGNDCDLDDPCLPGLFCGGLTLGGGMCINDWQHDTFVNSTQRFIPQDTPLPVATSVVVRGQATVPFDITVDIELAHSDPDSLKIVLFDPNGADAVLWDGPNEGGAEFPGSFIALGTISRDDMVNGRWLLRVWNEDGKGLGNLHGWTLWLSSNFD